MVVPIASMLPSSSAVPRIALITPRSTGTNSPSDALNGAGMISDTPDTVVATVPVGSLPGWAAYDSGRNEVFVPNAGSNNVSVISDATNRVVATIPVGSNPVGAAYDAGRSEVFVPNAGSDTVSVISDTTNTIVATVPVGVWPNGATYDPSRGEVFVTNQQSDNVSVISDATNRVVATIPVGLAPSSGPVYDAARGEVFVDNYESNNVSVISDATDQVVATIPVGSFPQGLAYDAGQGEVFVVNAGPGTVSVISDTTDAIVATIEVGPWPEGGAYDPANGDVFVANSGVGESGPGADTVSVISDKSNQVVATVPVGSAPDAVTYDAGRSEVFATNYESNNVSVIQIGPAYTVAFTESGLPSGMSWSVTLNGSFQNSAGSTIAFTEPNGTYSYTVAAVTGYTVAPSSGTLNVSGAAVSEPISFSPTTVATYAVKFIETGLPTGTNWSATLNGDTEFSTTSTIAFTQPNGTYSFTVASVSGYHVSPSSGNVTVSGAAVTESIAFSPRVATTTYAVTFMESGLPSGTTWSVALSGVDRNGSAPGSIEFNEANGTYSFTVRSVEGYTASPLSGSVMVNGAAVTETVTFTPSTATMYAVTLTESGLPSGTAWSVMLNGVTGGASAPGSVAFSEPNGTYSYTVGSPAGFTASPSSGSVTVNGAAVTETITFTPSTATMYAVTFTETGLPSGTEWSVMLNGAPGSASAPGSIAFSEPNGTYAYTVENVAGYTASALSGSVTVNGATVSETIPFTPSVVATTYAVTFTETGLPTGTSWSVTLNGVLQSSSTSTITFQEPNGTYRYSLGSLNKSYSGPGGSFTVDGAPVSEVAAFSKVISPGPVTISNNGTSWTVEATPTDLSSNSYQSVGPADLASSPFWTISGTFTASVGIRAIIFTQTQYSTWEVSSYEQALPAGSYVWATGNVLSGSVNATLSSGTYYLVWDNLNLYYSTSVRVTSAIVAIASFTQSYPVTFAEAGLPPGTSWSVTLGGSTQSSATSTITFMAANGTYSYTVGSASGYASRPSSGTVTVNGSSPSAVSASFTPTPSSSSGLPPWVYAVIGVVIVAVVVGGAVGLMRRRRPSTVSSPPPPTSPSSPIGGVGGSGQPLPAVVAAPSVPIVSPPRPQPPESSFPPSEPPGGSPGAPPTPTPPGPRFCPYCGHANRAEFTFCQKCGKQIPHIN